MKPVLALLSLTLAAALTAQAQQLQINGQRVPGNLLTLNGQRYVPLSALLAAGFQVSTAGGVTSITAGAGKVAAGGANPLAAQSGCLNQTLSDGVWSVRFSNLRLVSNDPKNYNAPYWALDVRVGNLTKETGDPYFYGLSPSALTWVGSDGNTWQGIGSVDGKNVNDLQFFKFLPGQSYSGQMSVQPKEGARQDRPPVKLVWPVDTQHNMAKVPWSSKDPSFRVDLTCSK